jgi:acetyl-CoA acyltransferase
MPGVFAQIGMEYGHRYGGTSFELFAKISEKNHAHSTLNPLAAYTKKMSLEEIMGDVMIAYPNTRPMCSANCDGAAAAVVVSGSKLKTLSLEQQRRAVKISASILTTDPWEESCQILPDVNTLTRNAATQAYEQAGVGPSDLDLVELHDCFATAELVHYDNLMLCEPGGAVDFFNSGATWRDGTTPVNVSGGLESKGHPIAATGIANVWEVATHLRGEAGDRQIEGAKVGLTHVIGLGSACGCTSWRRRRGSGTIRVRRTETARRRSDPKPGRLGPRSHRASWAEPDRCHPGSLSRLPGRTRPTDESRCLAVASLLSSARRWSSGPRTAIDELVSVRP